jgi:hypothetical protein
MAHLNAHSDKELTSGEIHKVIDLKPGAITNALAGRSTSAKPRLPR